VNKLLSSHRHLSPRRRRCRTAAARTFTSSTREAIVAGKVGEALSTAKAKVPEAEKNAAADPSPRPPAEAKTVQGQLVSFPNGSGVSKTTEAIVKAGLLSSRELYYDAREALIEAVKADRTFS